jgi:spore coat polysaccharide biosynthesis predicted glycosyltransferase SpsG
MRTLALAQAWRDGGGDARWLLAAAPESLVERIADEHIGIQRVDATPGSAADAAALRDALSDTASASAVVDGTQFDRDYLAELAPHGDRVLVVDDKADKGAYPVGWVLNQNAHADRDAFPPGTTARFLLGLRYVLLRREFVPAPPPRVIAAVAQRLLVTFGGADPTGMTLRTIDALRRLPHDLRERLAVRVIVGAANAEAARIEEAATDPALGTRVTVERAVDDMPARMTWADLAVTSGGSTGWELARLGCPALVDETVPVERLLVGGLRTVGLFAHLGPEAELDEATLAHAIASKAEDVAWRSTMSERGMALVDGAGARRVADVLAGLDAPTSGRDEHDGHDANDTEEDA